MYRKYYHLAPVPFGVWFTSILYWTHPIKGWRRNIDMIVVASALTFQCYCAIIGAENVVEYFVIMFFAVLAYPIGNYCQKTHSWLGAFGHSLIHIIGNIANVTLYSGYVKPFE
jgi:hypothetical protein